MANARAVARLVRAVQTNFAADIDAELCAAARANELDVDGEPLVYYACGHNSCAVVERLLELGVDGERRGPNGLHPVGLAASDDLDMVLRAWARQRPLPDTVLNNYTPLEIACGHGSLRVMRCLVEELGVPAQPNGSPDMSPLAMACYGKRHSAIHYLLEACRVDANARFGNDKTALYVCICQNDAVGVRLLLEFGADVRMIMPRERTLLMTACEFADLEIVRLIVEAGAPMDARTRSGYTALTFACDGGRLETVRYVLERSVLTTPLSYRWLDLRVAARKGYADIAALLMQHEAYDGDRTMLAPQKLENMVMLAARLPLAPDIRRLRLQHMTNDDLVMLAACLVHTRVEMLHLPLAEFGRPGVDALMAVLGRTCLCFVETGLPEFADMSEHPSLDWRRRVGAAGAWTPGVHARYPKRARARVLNVLMAGRLSGVPMGLLFALLAATARLNYA